MGNKSILIVDDEPIVRESIRDWLLDAGYLGAILSGQQWLVQVEQSVQAVNVRLAQARVGQLEHVKGSARHDVDDDVYEDGYKK